MRGTGPLPRQRPADTLPCCQITLRETASMSSSACSATAIALAPPFLETGTLARRGIEVDAVVAGAEQLYEAEVRGAAIEIVGHFHVRIAQHVLRIAHRISQFAPVAAHERQVEARGRHLAGDLADVGGRGHEND